MLQDTQCISGQRVCCKHEAPPLLRHLQGNATFHWACSARVPAATPISPHGLETAPEWLIQEPSFQKPERHKHLAV